MFKDREDAGRKLALKIKAVIKGSLETSLKRHSGIARTSASRIMLRDSGQASLPPKLQRRRARMTKEKDYLVVGIVRGGIVLAKIIGDYLNTSLHVLVIRKIGAPSNRELAIGAVGLPALAEASAGAKKIVYWDEDLIKRLNVSKSYRLSAVKEKTQEVERLEKIFSIDRKELDFRDKRVMLVDDGVATGTTVLCAQKILKMQRPRQLVLATPVISKESYANIQKYFDNIISLEKPLNFSAVGQFYRDFPQVEDEEVVALMSS